jgi:hypothetical protein
MDLEASQFDNSDPDAPSTHASVTLIAEGGFRLARLVALVDNIDKVVAHYKENVSVWAIQIHILKSHCVGNTQCLVDPDTTHYLWSDRTITHRRAVKSLSGAPYWECVDSLGLEQGCPYVLQADDAFVKFKERLQQQHAAHQRLATLFTGGAQAPEDEELN